MRQFAELFEAHRNHRSFSVRGKNNWLAVFVDFFFHFRKMVP
jgi:hypothetical protein